MHIIFLSSLCKKHEELKDSKQNDRQEGSRTGSASSAHSQSVNKTTHNNNDDNSDNNSKDNDTADGRSSQEKQQQQQQGSYSQRNSPALTGRADKEAGDDSRNASVNVKDNNSSTDILLQASEKAETSGIDSAKNDSESGNIESGSDNSKAATDQSLDASVETSTEQNSKIFSESSNEALAELSSSTQAKSEESTEGKPPAEPNDPEVETSSEDKIDQPSENPPAEKDGELPRSNTFVKDSSPSENDPVSKFAKKDLDTMDSVEIDACMKTLEEMVDQSLQSLMSGDKEEPEVLPANAELKKKILSEDFQKKIDSFLSDL